MNFKVYILLLFYLYFFPDDVPATGTGTLEIKLEDVNDNIPSINERNIRVCHPIGPIAL